MDSPRALLVNDTPNEMDDDIPDIPDIPEKHGGSLTHRRHTHMLTKEEKDKMNHFESLDFRLLDNVIWRNYQSNLPYNNHVSKTFGKWIIGFLIGVGVGTIVYFIKQSVDIIQELKFGWIEPHLTGKREFVAFMIYYSINLALGLGSCICVLLFGPVVSSSGIPEVKGYLNGIRIRKAFNIKTLIGKVLSLILSFSSGLILGPEGPMFHIGSTLGAALSQFKSKTFNLYSGIFWKFQNDVDKRDFISCGAAAGIASAFGAPIGGVLFAMEEGSSFWSQHLTWRTFFACLIATFTANLFLQRFQLFIHDYGVLTFGLSSTHLYAYPELIPFLIIGVSGGLVGAAFVHINVRLSKLRTQYLGAKRVHRLVEAAALITITSALSFGIPFLFPCRKISDINDSNSIEGDEPPSIVQFSCESEHYNDMASLFYTTSEKALRLLYNRGTDIFTLVTLPIFSLIYFMLATVTSGVYMASGIFIPMMIVGASLGRFVGRVVELIIPHFSIDAAIYSMVGSAAMMAGSMRLTISLVVIIVELTEGTQYLLPIILVVMVAKWVGDFFNESIYEHLIELKHIPYLPAHPPHATEKLLVKDVMSKTVFTLPPLVRVRDVLKILRTTKHNGFPVVMDAIIDHGASTSTGDIDDVELENFSLARSASAPLRSSTSFFRSLSTQSSSAHLVSPRQQFLQRASTYSSPSVSLRSSLAGSTDSATTSPTPAPPPPLPLENKKLAGMMLRSQLLILLQRRLFGPENCFAPLDTHPADLVNEEHPISHKDFMVALSKEQPEINSLPIVDEDLDSYVDVRPYMNLSSVTVSKWFSFTEAYNLFRSLGLRHVVVVDEKNEVVGILTRKDFL